MNIIDRTRVYIWTRGKFIYIYIYRSLFSISFFRINYPPPFPSPSLHKSTDHASPSPPPTNNNNNNNGYTELISLLVREKKIHSLMK